MREKTPFSFWGPLEEFGGFLALIPVPRGGGGGTCLHNACC